MVVKEPKVYYGRINRTVKLPAGLHNRIKNLAQLQSVPVSHFYDRILEDFLKEHTVTPKMVTYLFHKRKVDTVAIAFKKELVYGVKSISERDSVSENRAIFTAIILFCEKKSLLDD